MGFRLRFSGRCSRLACWCVLGVSHNRSRKRVLELSAEGRTVRKNRQRAGQRASNFDGIMAQTYNRLAGGLGAYRQQIKPKSREVIGGERTSKMERPPQSALGCKDTCGERKHQIGEKGAWGERLSPQPDIAVTLDEAVTLAQVVTLDQAITLNESITLDQAVNRETRVNYSCIQRSCPSKYELRNSRTVSITPYSEILQHLYSEWQLWLITVSSNPSQNLNAVSRLRFELRKG